MPTFIDGDGRLTPYSLRCGYLEQKSTNPERFRENDLYTELSHESDHFQVKQYDRRSGGIQLVFWHSFSDDDFEQARAQFDAAPGEPVCRNWC